MSESSKHINHKEIAKRVKEMTKYIKLGAKKRYQKFLLMQLKSVVNEFAGYCLNKDIYSIRFKKDYQMFKPERFLKDCRIESMRGDDKGRCKMKKRDISKKAYKDGKIKKLGNDCYSVPSEFFVLGITPRLVSKVLQ